MTQQRTTTSGQPTHRRLEATDGELQQHVTGLLGGGRADSPAEPAWFVEFLARFAPLDPDLWD